MDSALCPSQLLLMSCSSSVQTPPIQPSLLLLRDRRCYHHRGDVMRNTRTWCASLPSSSRIPVPPMRVPLPVPAYDPPMRVPLPVPACDPPMRVPLPVPAYGSERKKPPHQRPPYGLLKTKQRVSAAADSMERWPRRRWPTVPGTRTAQWPPRPAA